MISESILLPLGFSKKEAKIYLACIELGLATVLQISRHSQLSRGTIYDLIPDMLNKGFIHQVKKEDRLFFAAIDPEVIQFQHQKKLRHFELALPELRGLFHKHEQPSVRYFEGLEGVWQVYEDTLTSTTEILNYANSKKVREFFPDYDEKYVEVRAKKQIFLKGIAPDDTYGKKVKKEDKKYYREVQLLSEKEFSFTNEINIYDNKLAIISFQDRPMGVIIESQAVADTQRDIFKMAWQFAQMKQNHAGQGNLFY